MGRAARAAIALKLSRPCSDAVQKNCSPASKSIGANQNAMFRPLIQFAHRSKMNAQPTLPEMKLDFKVVKGEASPRRTSHMNSRSAFRLCLAVFVGLNLHPSLPASEPPPPVIESLTATGGVKNLRFAPYPAAEAYSILSARDLASPFVPDTNFFLAPYITGYTVITNNTSNGPVVMTVTNLAYEWRSTNASAPSGFYKVGVTPLSSNAVLTANVLSRLAYGPTPDELERVMAIGPQAFIDEQMNFEGIPETMDNYTVVVSNSVASDPTTNWTYLTLTGTVASTTFYLFMTAPGEMFIDDIELRPFNFFENITTNVVNGTNAYVTNKVFSHIASSVLNNGGFESAYGAGSGSWTNAGGHSGSAPSNTRARSGTYSLRVVSTTSGTAPGSSYIRQGFSNTYQTTNSWGQTVTLTRASTDPVVLSYWYLPGIDSTKLRLQLGSGLNSTPGGIPPTPAWVYATATGTASSTPQLYIYLSGSGTAYLDDIKLVAGSVPEVGANLLANAGFESGMSSWIGAGNHSNSVVSSTIGRSGSGSLQVVSTGTGSSSGNSVNQINIPGLTSGQTYTVSYWYVPAPGRTLTVRLSGSGLLSSDTDAGSLYRKLETTSAAIGDLRAWFSLHAVNSPRQLFEILSQFWENHFVTQYSKSRDYLQGRGYDSTTAGILATDWEFREMTRWRNAMLNPQCTFYDLLKISAESPAMIVYLDSVNSRGSGNNIANENYARELLELFTFGVDNGYDQNDIILMSRAWTGWSVELVDEVNANNPFAPASVTYMPGTNSTSKANTVGVWAFNYKAANHGTNRGALFPGATVPARFGPPWAGRNYQLNIPPRATGATNSIQDGYDVIAHLANQPFTQEYISVKLCRLFVHEDFPNPTTTPGHPEYDFYDYTNPNMSAEARLVRDCMLAWENSNPKGQIRAVLNVIFNSDLFRSHTAAAQKVKTPLEFVASSVRALRSVNPNGTATANTDGFSFATRLNNMGGMGLFDRGDPDGYPEGGASWISAGTLVERIRYIQAFCNAGTGDDAGNHVCDPVALLKKKLPAASWNNAGAVADYFLAILYPGEGAGNLALYRQAAINFLNTADNGTTASLFSSLGNTTTTYDTRVRGMVAMLMTFQRFQEQ